MRIAQILGIDNNDKSSLLLSDISLLSIDSRKISNPFQTLFFAIDGRRKKGEEFIAECYQKGVRNFVVHKDSKISNEFKNAHFFKVENVVLALQKIATAHRNQFNIPVIGITGSNGKTIVKEWLSQLLQVNMPVAKNPKSFNSQIGVPLSVWNIAPQHQVGIFEAGISKPDEMRVLSEIIQPSIGIFTFLGQAHLENFENQFELLSEKSILFENVQKLLIPNQPVVVEFFEQWHRKFPNTTIYKWGYLPDQSLDFEFEKKDKNLLLKYKNQTYQLPCPFELRAHLHNYCTAWASIFMIGYSPEPYILAAKNLKPLEMRLEIVEGINSCKLIDDTYSADLASLSEAIDFLEQQGGNSDNILILSELISGNISNSNTLMSLIENLQRRKLEKIFLIGKSFALHFQKIIDNLPNAAIFSTAAEFLEVHPPHLFSQKTILFKGARVFEFERLVKSFQLKIHETKLEVNLNAIKHNLNTFSEQLFPNTKIMIMLKAFGYGLGSRELAKVLEHQRADYFAVAYLDEGIELRKTGINTPIMVMNPEIENLDALFEYSLEPEIYSLSLLERLLEKVETSLENGQISIHIKLDTGMNRLGFRAEDISEMLQLIIKSEKVRVASVFSHLAASDEPTMRDFTLTQIAQFSEMYQKISQTLGYKPIRHILNTQGIVNFPESQFEMVRLGLGLFGIDSSAEGKLDLQFPLRLLAKISQIRSIKAGESVGYSRKGIATKDTKIGIISIGYADGYSRFFGNGNAEVFGAGVRYPTIGNICMDMTMIDLGLNSKLKEGDWVELIGLNIQIEKLASAAHTIPYEILTNIGARVKRIYYEE